MTHRIAVSLTLCGILMVAMLTSTSAATNSALPYGLPSVARVVNTVKGKSPMDTLARQAGVFDQLINMLENSEGPRQFTGNKTVAEQRLRRDYSDAINRIVATAQKDYSHNLYSHDDPDNTWTKWIYARWGYSEDSDYILRTFLSKAAQIAYKRADAQEKASEAAGQKYGSAPYDNSSGVTDRHNSSVLDWIPWIAGGLVLAIYLGIPLFGKILEIILDSIFGCIFGRDTYSGGGGYTSSSNSSSFSSSSKEWYDKQPQTCSNCGGSGQVQCPNGACRGGYLYEGGNSFSRYCPTCLGRGTVTDPMCNGTGKR